MDLVKVDDRKSLWQYSAAHNRAYEFIEEQTLWGQTVCCVCLPNQDVVVRVPHAALGSEITAKVRAKEKH